MGRNAWIVGTGAGALMILACGSGTDSDFASYRNKAAPAPPSVPPVAFTVAPDRVLIPLSIAVVADDYAAAGNKLRKRIGAVEAAGGTAGCAVRTLDYDPPSSLPRTGWTAGAQLVADAPLVGLETVTERMDALDRCRVALLGAEGFAEDELALGAHVLRVDAPEDRHAALSERFAADQARAASLPGPQSHPEDRRCVPTGRVLVGEARLDGVALSLEVECRVAAGPTPGA